MKKIFGERLKELRLKGNLIQQDLADEFNVSLSTLSFWENGKNFPEIPVLIEIAEFFNVSVDYLLGIETKSIIQNTAAPLDKDEQKLLETFRAFTPVKKKALFEMLEIENKKK